MIRQINEGTNVFGLRRKSKKEPQRQNKLGLQKYTLLNTKAQKLFLWE
jgi:hypothetical protein